ncbi:MAG: hypothetical protein HY348_10245 [Nitrospira defluvii]|nr:hypothetical protein [Nitrospira defluvii]
MTLGRQNTSTWWVLLLVGLWPTLAAADEPSIKLYNVPEGQITSKVIGPGPQVGTGTFAFRKNGLEGRRETHTTTQIMGITQENHSVVYTDGLWMYQFDPEKNEAIKRKNPMFASLAEQDQLARLKNGEAFMKALGGVITGKDKVLGHACDIWELKQLMTTTCVTSEWLALWTKSGMGNMGIQETATSINIGPVPPGSTSLPPGVRVVEGADPMEQLRQLRQQSPGRSSTRKKKSRPLTAEEMQEAEKMRDQFQGKDMNQMMESMKKMQEQFKPKSGAPSE